MRFRIEKDYMLRTILCGYCCPLILSSALAWMLACFRKWRPVVSHLGRVQPHRRENGMKKLVFLILSLTPALLLAERTDANKRIDDADKRMQNATTILTEVMGTDKGIPNKILANAQCIGVIPGEKKAGFIVAARYGKGIVVCRTQHGWSAPSNIVVEGGSVGFQIGADSTDVVLVVRNKRGEDKLMQDKFTINAGAGAAAG